MIKVKKENFYYYQEMELVQRLYGEVKKIINWFNSKRSLRF